MFYCIYGGDIISNLDSFTKNDLDKLAREITIFNGSTLVTDTLYDEIKIETVNRIYNTHTLDELNEILKNKNK